MTIYLAHHRSFCEQLGHMHTLDVSWDGKGSLPLKRKALTSAMELFGRRPDLTIGSSVRLVRGGLEISIFREASDILMHICKAGSIQISRHRPQFPPDFMVSSVTVTEPLLAKIEEIVPSSAETPVLSTKAENDVCLKTPFEGFVVLRLEKSGKPGHCQLLMGREGPVSGLYAFHDVINLPEDIYQDQPLSEGSGLCALVTSYIQEKCRYCSPA